MTVRYEPGVIIDFAQRLYSQARSVEAIYAVIGAMLGGLAGILLGMQIAGGAIAFLLAALGVVSVGLFGLVIGRTRANSLRLQAQTALCQVQIEANTRGAHTRTQG